MRPLRVALFPCAYNEVDGVANTMRHFEAFAKKQEFPLLNVHGGFGSYHRREGSLEQVEFERRWPKFRLDAKHDFDMNFWRYVRKAEETVRKFRADLVHITGPSDVGQLGALVAHRLQLPLVASWHTNVHEYAERRALPLLPFLPSSVRRTLGNHICEFSLYLCARFYKIARVLFAPNQELISKLEKLTGKACHLMSRGVDQELFHPRRRVRRDKQFVIGYVGRLTNEKNIQFLAELESGLLARNCSDFRLMIVGQGAEEAWLKSHLRHAEFPGVLQGERLAEAYANFDVFAFPSRTDTFGNVVLEALASGVPAIVTEGGGPKFIVQHGTTGFIAHSDGQFIKHVATLHNHPELCAEMSRAARQRALASSWDQVFRHVYEIYQSAVMPILAGDLIPVRARA